jgi:hypothetical protein
MLKWTLIAALAFAVLNEARADDPGIPQRCRSREAQDNAKCAEIIDARFKERNLRLNRRDAAANATLVQRILATPTKSGDSISGVLNYASQHIPFAVLNSNFVYARSGAEYIVMEYGASGSEKPTPDEALDRMSFFDYDLETDPVFSLQNSRAVDFLVWKVTGSSLLPSGNYTNMLLLGPEAFVYAVNSGRKGFDNSGYNEALDHDLSFFSRVDAGGGKLSDYVNPTSPGLSLYWNVVQGYVAMSDDGQCPPRTVGLFTIRGPNCEERAVAARDVFGNVLPFTVIRAIRNYAFKDGMVEAAVSISLKGGEPADWMATAVYVAEHSVVRDVTFVTVEVFVPNPWDDFPPQGHKILAKVYYAPNPARSPWKQQWSIFSATKAATLADIEYDKLSNDLIDDTPDPDLRMRKAENAAKRVVVQKYSLPGTWKPADDLGLDGHQHDREHVHIAPMSGIDSSMSVLQDCLTKNSGSSLFRGCVPQRSSN